MNKRIIVLVLIVVIIGLIIGVTVNFKSEIENKSDLNQSNKNIPTRPLITVTKTPQPTFPPLSKVVKEVNQNSIIVTGDRGDMNLPKDSTIINVYQRIQNQLVVKAFDDVKVGQNVTVNIIKPGVLAEIIIENQP
ncbi:hypothetical protein HY338_03715 [Candidatus Gottesmanbacteria bacterium]|nr:hypothetical protein [Candidatus Gottesmanbacteria bacterium]